MNELWAPLFVRLKRLQASWPSPQWKWDGRLCALECAFPSTSAAAARASASEVLTAEWTSATLPTAPEQVRAICASTGGLRGGQLLLTSEPVEGVIPYGLWWPWGGGTNITLRVGLADLDDSVEPFPQLRELFGVRL